MYQIFNALGWLVGYILYFFYFLVRNYGVAIILFTVILNLAMFPTYVKQQKSMAGNTRMQKKMRELQKIYKDDKRKLQEEQAKLMQEEGNNAFGCNAGCVMSILPLIIFMGLFYALSSPLTNMLHLDAASVSNAVNFINTVPGDVFASSSGGYASTYRQIDLIKSFAETQPYLSQFFSAGDLAKLQQFSTSFSFLGLDLLQTPAVSGHFWQTLFTTPLFILPLLSLALQIFTQFYSMRSQRKTGQQAMNQQGCMMVFMIIMAVWMFYITCIVPAAMGIYYVLNGVMGFVRIWAMQKFYSPAQVTARSEGEHYLRIAGEEAAIKELPIAVQQELERKIRNWNQTSPNGDAASKKKSQKAAGTSPASGSAKAAKGNKRSSGKDNYLGKKR